MGSTGSTAEVDPIIPVVNEFSFRFLKVITSNNDHSNVLFSPSSLAAGIALMHMGSKHGTADEISNVMNFAQAESSHLHASVGALRSLLFEESDLCKFHGANKIYCPTDVKIDKKFRKQAQDLYQTIVEAASFAEPEVVAQNVNHWLKLSGTFHGDDVITHQNIDISDRLVMVNALCFVGRLEAPFQKSSTKIGKFFPSGTENYNVPMMNVKCSFPYFYDGEMRCQILELPYTGNNFRIIIVLPEIRSGLKDVESRLTVDNLQKWCRPREMDVVDVHLPRFDVEQLSDTSDTLRQLGISALFNPGLADLSGIGDKLHLSRFLHYSRVRVAEDESFSEGKKVDVHSFVTSCETFRADHPFLFLVQDKRKGAIVFIGRVLRPPKMSENELKEIFRQAKERLRAETEKT